MNKTNEIEEKVNTQEKQEISCIICKITEEKAKSKNITLTKMSDIVDKRFNEEICLKIESIMPDIVSGYVCSKCIETTNRVVEKMITLKNSMEHKTLSNLEDEIESYSDYISSSAHLFKLDHIIVVQSCFNTFIYGIDSLSEYNIKFSEHIIKSSIIELERKLLELNKLKSTGQ